MRRWLDRAPGLLGHPWLPTAAILIALLLVSPCLGVGPMGDDSMRMARVDPRLHAPGFAYSPLDLFTFVSGDAAQRAVLREEGIWWMVPDFRMSFWRPRSFVLAHAQSMLWLAAMLAVLAALYRPFHVPWIANLALVLYAVDDARGWTEAAVRARPAFWTGTGWCDASRPPLW